MLMMALSQCRYIGYHFTACANARPIVTMDFYTIALLVFGVPLIVWLTVRAIRKVRDISVRIKEVQEELARNPQAAAQGMAEIMARRKTASKRKPGVGKDKRLL